VIKAVFKFANGMVAVFDENGEQLPKYQGPYEAVKADILRDASAEAEFYSIALAVQRENW